MKDRLRKIALYVIGAAAVSFLTLLIVSGTVGDLYTGFKTRIERFANTGEAIAETSRRDEVLAKLEADNMAAIDKLARSPRQKLPDLNPFSHYLQGDEVTPSSPKYNEELHLRIVCSHIGFDEILKNTPLPTTAKELVSFKADVIAQFEVLAATCNDDPVKEKNQIELFRTKFWPNLLWQISNR